MKKTLALLHTTPVTVASMKELAARLAPEVRVVNILDDSLLADAIAAGGVTEAVRGRLESYVEQAVKAGADAVMCCCSSVGEVIDAARARTPVPLLRIDRPMAREAVRLGHRVGVMATVRTTLEPTARLVEAEARAAGKAVELRTVLVEGAFEALQRGDGAEHDRRVVAALERLLQEVDVVVLAQASMARLLAHLTQPPRVPVLSSPASGLGAALEALGQEVGG
ncbi:aspartate/glutamate racemase family protein [Calidithermus chliarophilus]|uniref:aspartate/glutamate racemase family protein n=1 Tax=Calidithermus chliarophilus TaxID=52023 RepID=UPI00040BEA52|nr:aspartate/glutamate racemase family protein [Calidithermus chliarophilus]